MGHMVTVEEAKGKRERLLFIASKLSFFFFGISRVEGSKMSYILPGAHTILSLFLTKPDWGSAKSSVSSRDSTSGTRDGNYRPCYHAKNLQQ